MADNIEVILIGMQILLIPILQFAFQAIKRQMITDTKAIILEHYTSLEALIDYNKEKIEFLQSKIEHKNQINVIDSRIIKNRIKDIELYLAKHLSYVIRHEDDETGGFL
jgi:hypothetical protein